VIRLDYYGPHGSRLSQWYDWDTAQKWRVRKLEIDPKDGGVPIIVDISL